MQVSYDLVLTCSLLSQDTNPEQLFLLQLEIRSYTSLDAII